MLPIGIISLLNFHSCISTSDLLLGQNSFGEKNLRLENYQAINKNDFLDQLNAFIPIYLNSPGTQIYPIKDPSKNYLQDLLGKIISKNEPFFGKIPIPEITIIKSDFPFYFSLPYNQIFISSAIFEKYIRYEGDIIAILIYELIKTTKQVYYPILLPPINNIGIEKILSITRIEMEDKLNIHKWSIYILKRSGLEANFVINWISLINKNSLDFVQLLGDFKSIAKEDLYIRQYLIQKKITKKIKNTNLKSKKNSSVAFYEFINNFKNKI